MITPQTFPCSLATLLVWLAVAPGLDACAATNNLPAAVDLRPRFESWGLISRSQGNRPTCSVVTFTGALEFALAGARQRGAPLSAEYLNWAANQTRQLPRDGGFFSEMWAGFKVHGICAEALMPYSKSFDPSARPNEAARVDGAKNLAAGLEIHWIKEWNVETGLSDQEFTALKQTLAGGAPVCGGFRWPKKVVWKDGILQLCPAEEVFDGHSVLLVGYQNDARQPGGGVFIFRNSNGNNQDGCMPYEYARRFLNDAIWLSAPKEISKSGTRTNP